MCSVVPTVEEKSEDVEFCHIEPEKVSSDLEQEQEQEQEQDQEQEQEQDQCSTYFSSRAPVCRQSQIEGLPLPAHW